MTGIIERKPTRQARKVTPQRRVYDVYVANSDTSVAEIILYDDRIAVYDADGNQVFFDTRKPRRVKA